MRRRSSHKFKYAIPTNRPWPVPEHPGVLALRNREKDHLGPANQILERHVAKHPAVAGIIAIVAHHKETSRRHFVDIGVVGKAGAIDTIERLVSDVVWQGFFPAFHPRRRL